MHSLRLARQPSGQLTTRETERMKLIWLSHFMPFPPIGGAHQRSYHLLRQASRNYEVILIAFNRPAENPETLALYEKELRKFCAEVEFWNLPFPWKGARWWAGLLINTFQSDPYSCHVYQSRVLLSRWREILRKHPDALVHVDSSDLAAFADAAHDRRILLNHHNSESAMAFRRAGLEPNPARKLLLFAQAKKQAALEKRLGLRVSVNAVVSREDGRSLRVQCPSAHVHVVENGTDTEYFAPFQATSEPNTLVFAASLNWYPNISALRYFRELIWPKLRNEIPELRCFIAGQNPVREIEQWADADPAITLIANPPDIRPWIAKGNVVICPMVDGGGTRLKLLDAMSAGKAIVTTRVGAEGLGIEHGKEALIADSAEEFARLTVRLLGDSSLQAELVQNARSFVVKRFGWDTIGKNLAAAYACPGCKNGDAQFGR